MASAWTRDGRWLLITTAGPRGAATRGSVVVIDAATWSPARRVLTLGDATAIEVSPDGRLIALGTQSGDIIIADADTYQLKHRLHVDDRYSRLSFSDDGTRLAVVEETAGG